MQSPTGEYTFTDLTKLLYHTVILHSKITPKRPQITLDFPKSMHLGHIFLLRLAKTVFHHYPRLLHKPREPAHTSKGLSVAAFCTKCGKKTYQCTMCIVRWPCGQKLKSKKKLSDGKKIFLRLFFLCCFRKKTLKLVSLFIFRH